MTAKATQLVTGFRVSKDTDAEGQSTVLGHNKLEIGGATLEAASGAMSFSGRQTITATTGPQHTVQYDSTHGMETTVDAAGNATIAVDGTLSFTPVGGSSVFAGDVNVGAGNITVSEGEIRVSPAGIPAASLQAGANAAISLVSEDSYPAFNFAGHLASDTWHQSPGIITTRARGTAAVPTDTALSDRLRRDAIRMYETGASHVSAEAVWRVPAAGTVGPASHPVEYTVSTCAEGEIATVNRFGITGAGVFHVSGDPMNIQVTRAGCTTTGLDGNPTVDVVYQQSGRVVTVYVPAITDTQTVGGAAVVTIDLAGGASTEVVPLPTAAIDFHGGGYNDNAGTLGGCLNTLSAANVITIRDNAYTAFSGGAGGLVLNAFCYTYMTA